MRHIEFVINETIPQHLRRLNTMRYPIDALPLSARAQGHARMAEAAQ